jgi:hypothetical protein
MTAETLLDRNIGPESLVVTLDGQVLDLDRLGAVTIRHGRAQVDAQPAPATVTLTTNSPLLPRVGQRLTVELGPDAAAYFGTGEAARWRFAGTVSDAAVTPGPGVSDRRRRVPVTAVGHTARLGRVLVGDVPWPAESDGARALRILALAGAAGSQDWTGGATSGWFGTWLGVPGAAAITNGSPFDAEAVRIEWEPGSTTDGGFAWRYTSPQVAGKAYTITAEVYVPAGQPPVHVTNLFVSDGPAVEPADRWQAITHTYVAPDNLDRAVGVGIPIDAARPAGRHCYVRALRVYESEAPILGDVDPGTVELLGRDVDRQPALQLLHSVAGDAEGTLLELRDGRLEYQDARHRVLAATDLELDASLVLWPLTWTQDLAGMVNDVTVAWGDAQPQEEVRVADQLSIATHGTLQARIGTQLANEDDAERMALLLVARRGLPWWDLSTLSVELVRGCPPAVAAQLLDLEVSDLVAVTGFPTDGPLSLGRLWVEGWTETITSTGWRLTLAVSPYGRTGPTARWADLPATLTWAELEPTLSWASAASWDTGSAPDGRWIGTPGDLSWADIDPATTWATWPY